MGGYTPTECSTALDSFMQFKRNPKATFPTAVAETLEDLTLIVPPTKAQNTTLFNTIKTTIETPVKMKIPKEAVSGDASDDRSEMQKDQRTWFKYTATTKGAPYPSLYYNHSTREVQPNLPIHAMDRRLAG